MTTSTTPAKLAARWEVSTTMVYDLLNSGELPGFRLGGKLWRIKLEDVAAYEARPAPEPTPRTIPDVSLPKGAVPQVLVDRRTELRLARLCVVARRSARKPDLRPCKPRSCR